ncbi:MAG: hypothetical protein ACFN4T_00165 [Peptidiphaga sp.]|jgi:hypothetical protein
MGEIRIVEGDLEPFAKTVGSIPEERLKSVDGETILREATVGMPGSDSKAYAAGYGAAVNEECKKTSAGLKKFKENMLAAAAEYSQAEDDTTTAGKVAKLVRKGVLDDLVMYGSPGAGAHDAREYNLDHDRAYVSGIKSDDAVKGKGTLNSKFGNNPMVMPGVKHLANNSERDRLFFIPWKMFDRHLEYLEEGTSSLEDISRVVTKVPVKGER